jgi:hypothetical protein
MSTKSTLLDIVQDILGEMSSDEVNSITDTEDSEQVARIVRTVYKNIITKNTWPHTRKALTLVARSDSNFPTHMVIEDDLMELASVYYNKSLYGETQKKYDEVDFVDPDEFLRRTHKRNSDEADVDVVIDDSGIELLIKNDKHPDFFTTFNDEDLVFDSYNSDVDSTLHIAKFQAQGYVLPEFKLEDSFVPDLPADAFPLLIEEATSRAQFKMRQMVDQKSEQESGKQSRKMSRKSWVVNGGIKYPNYGRKR